MATAPIPRRRPAALPAPSSARKSAWPQLDPSARALLLDQVLVFNPELFVSGGVDFDSPVEPLLSDRQGNFFTLLGDRVGGNSLVVDVFPGIDRTRLLAVAGLALLGIVLLTR